MQVAECNQKEIGSNGPIRFTSKGETTLFSVREKNRLTVHLVPPCPLCGHRDGEHVTCLYRTPLHLTIQYISLPKFVGTKTY